MTIVVTTASQHGITVVGDKAETLHDGRVFNTARKVYYAAAANVSLAFWGNARMPGGTLGAWAEQFVARVTAVDSLEDVGTRLARELTSALSPPPHGVWHSSRRGVHVAGYSGGVPCIYHVHTGDPNHGEHEPRLYRDFPDLFGGPPDAYLASMTAGGRVQLRNGHYSLYGTVSEMFGSFASELEEEIGSPVPAPTIQGQLALDRAIVRFAANLLAAANTPQRVSEEVDCVAFTAHGLVPNAHEFESEVVSSVPRAQRQSTLNLALPFQTLGVGSVIDIRYGRGDVKRSLSRKKKRE
jgi:hypothetical protein